MAKANNRWSSMNAIIDSSAFARISPVAGKVLFVLFRYANTNGDVWPSLAKLTNRTGLSLRSVQRARRELLDAGLLQIIDQIGGRPRVDCPEGTTARYRLLEPIKGDATVPLNQAKRVTPRTPYRPKRVTPQVKKGDTRRPKRVTPVSPRTEHRTEQRTTPPTPPKGGCEQEFALGTEAPSKKPRARTPRDDLWDVLESLYFPSGVSKADQSRIGRAVSALVAKKATPEDVRIRHKRYGEMWPDMANTINALVMHWDQFSKPPPGKPGRVAAKEGKYGRVPVIDAS